MARSTLIFLDIETAGLTEDAPIIEFAAIATESGTFRELDSIDCKVEFATSDADPVALGVNKFSPSAWERYAIAEKDAATKLSLFLKRHATIEHVSKKSKKPYRVAQLAAHNAEFDVTRIERWFGKLGIFFPASRKALCTEQLARWFIETHQELSPPYDYKLGTLAYYFSLQTVPDHTALADTRTAAELAKRISQLQVASHSAAA